MHDMICIAPTVTLFPYTTLFRSAGAAGALSVGLGVAQPTPLARPSRRPHDAGNTEVRVRAVVQRVREASVQVAGEEVGAIGAGLDRKSTRLNSSHVKISYAVFCL